MKPLKNELKSYLLISILILAAVLRFNHINQPYVDAFNWRQTSTAMMADNYYRTNWNILFPEVSWGGPGPSYQGRELQTVSYLAAILYTIVGQQDWVGRSIAVVFSLWGILAFYQLVRHVWDDDRALASAAILAVLPGGIFIDRSFLPDPAMVSLVVTSFWLFIIYLKTDKRHYLILAGLIGTWGFLTKITGLIVCIPMLYVMVKILRQTQQLTPRIILQKLWPIALTMTLGLSLVAAYYLWARYLALNYPPYHFAGAHNWIWIRGLGNWMYNNFFLPKFWHHAQGWLWTMPVMVLAGLGLLIPYRSKLASTAGLQLPGVFHWWFVGAAIYYIIGAQELVDNPWNFHLFNPMIAGFAGHSMVSIANYVSPLQRITLPQYFSTQLPRHALPAFIVIVLIMGTIGFSGHTSLKDMYRQPWSNQSYALGLQLRQVSQPGDLVVTMASDLGSPNALYYSHRRGWVFPLPLPDTDWSQFPDKDDDSIAMFETLRAQGADWLGIAEQRKQDFWRHHPKLVAYIKANCQYQMHSEAGVIYRILPVGVTQSSN